MIVINDWKGNKRHTTKAGVTDWIKIPLPAYSMASMREKWSTSDNVNENEMGLRMKDTSFGGTISREKRSRSNAGDGTDVDDASLAFVHHRRQCILSDVGSCFDVNLIVVISYHIPPLPLPSPALSYQNFLLL